MTIIKVVIAAVLLATPVLAQSPPNEIVIEGEVLSVSPNDGTLKVKEIAEPPEGARPGTMQSGVVREFTVSGETKLVTEGRTLQLADIRTGDRVVIHYVLGTGKNVARSITVSSRATE